MTGLVSAADGTVRLLECVTVDGYDAWLQAQPEAVRQWLADTGFEPKARRYAMLPAVDGDARVLALLDGFDDVWGLGDLPHRLPAGCYRLRAWRTQCNSTRLHWAGRWAVTVIPATRRSRGAKRRRC
ncbi:MAG: hypothetical protein P8Z69_09645 [Acidihalobacter sp.]